MEKAIMTKEELIKFDNDVKIANEIVDDLANQVIKNLEVKEKEISKTFFVLTYVNAILFANIFEATLKTIETTESKQDNNSYKEVVRSQTVLIINQYLKQIGFNISINNLNLKMNIN